jgi:hypothetical protein
VTPPPVVTPPPALFVRFEADGSKSGTSVAASSVAHNTYFVLFVDTLSGATCTLSEASHGSLALGSAPGTSPSFVARWGRDAPPHPWWDAGTYTITATCSLSGHSPVSAQKVVHIT